MLLLFFQSINSSLEQRVEQMNDQTYEKLDFLSKTEYFSKIKLNFYEKCPKIVESCNVTSCAVPRIKYKNEDGYIDLLSVVESYSPSVRQSSQVWSDIYASLPDQTLRNIISGLHFSVTTHIAIFFIPSPP